MSRCSLGVCLASLGMVLGLGMIAGGCTSDTLAIFPIENGDGPLVADESGDGSEGDSEGDSDDDGSDDSGGLTDLPDEGDAAACRVEEGLDAALPCDAPTPSLEFSPEIAWTWTGPGGEDSVLVSPLVANLDDDNDDGGVDLCDTPDIVVIAVDAPANKNTLVPAGHLYLIDSITGETERFIDHEVDPEANPALADLDGDGRSEIIALERSVDVLGELGSRRVVAFEADGSVMWVSDTWVETDDAARIGGGVAVADLDGDGSPEILAPEHVLDAEGSLLWVPDNGDAAPLDSVPIAADLDLDGDLEVLYGASVYDHSGELLFELVGNGNDNKNAGAVAIANFDDDPEPELYSLRQKHHIYDHTGELVASCGAGNAKQYPVTVVDTNGDGRAEILAKHGAWFRAKQLVQDSGGDYECETVWQIKISGGTAAAFDFLADGAAEAIVADHEWVRVIDGQGTPLVEFERPARDSLATPVVADADNDGAAELLIVASEPEGGDPEVAGNRVSLMLVHNADDRFAPTRRIWNQHAYHATNIREDGSVPAQQQAHWSAEGLNSFRSNVAPSYAGGLCQDPLFE